MGLAAEVLTMLSKTPSAPVYSPAPGVIPDMARDDWDAERWLDEGGRVGSEA
jgi:hypothetical protein